MPLNPVNSVNPVLSSPDKLQQSQRIEALDWVKGALVIFMVIYHGINYSAFRPLAFQYLSFVPPSFLLIAGFLVGQVYATKYDLGSWKPYLRLVTRGLKLLLLFTALNILNCILLERSLTHGFWLFFDRAYPIFISGNGRVGVFEVLLPIAYFLLLAPALLRLRAHAVFLVPILTALILLLGVFLERRGASLDNLNLLSYGFLGMALGLVPMPKIDRVVVRWLPVLSAYIIYRLTSRFVGETYLVQAFAAVTSLALLYCFASHLDSRNWSWRQVVRLGNYSLFGYLAQILLLRVVVKLLGGLPETAFMVGAVIIVTTILLYALVLFMDWSRKIRPVNVAYKSVFA